jgi:RNA polymerase sigma-70 factor, ECF subfamily
MDTMTMSRPPRGGIAERPRPAEQSRPNRPWERRVTDAADFAEFYAATFHPLCVQLYAHTGDLAEAQDVVQEAFCRALPRWNTLSKYDDPAAWVRKVAWNLATSRWRRVKRYMEIIRAKEPELVDGPGSDRIDLMAALAVLPLRQRQAVVLHYLADASVAEIAQLTGAAEGTVKSWLHRARATLAERLGENYPLGEGVRDV